MKIDDLELIKRIFEGALMAADKPLQRRDLTALFDDLEQPEDSLIDQALKDLVADCEDKGFELKRVASGYRYQVKQDLSRWVNKLWQERAPRYSRALLETMSLIAYRQPITRGEIEQIRGVAVSSQIIKTLLEREWIKSVGHRDVPGRPTIYATTKQFLDYFNLKSLDQLPPLAEVRDLNTISRELNIELPIEDMTSANDDTREEGADQQSAVASIDGEPPITALNDEAQLLNNDLIDADQQQANLSNDQQVSDSLEETDALENWIEDELLDNNEQSADMIESQQDDQSDFEATELKPLNESAI
ncbi:MAG: SMC-Scp complex subunit ScpB [Oceanospirillaceae bacterium]|nr:SMC-Scp complex subunit ScpB [Oceanospirillaceae bacterium]